MVFVGSRGRCLVKPHVEGSIAGTVVKIHDKALCPLRHLDLEVLIQAFIPAQQSIFNTWRERDGVIWVNVFGWIDKVCDDGKFTCIPKAVSRDVVQARFEIKEMNFFLVSWTGRPGFQFGH